MTQSLAVDLSAAFDERDIERSAQSAKSMTIAALKGIDPSTEIRVTEYFNHTFAPDLVMTWPGDVSKRERLVFLRTTSRAEYLAEDLEIIGHREALMLTLSDMPEERDKIDNAARTHSSMITDPSGIDALWNQKKAAKVSGLMSSATIRGGIGSIGAREVLHTGAAIEKGFAAARTLDARGVRDAQNALNQTLIESMAADIDRFLLALWLASDGRQDQFPGSPVVGGSPLTNDSLFNLLHLDRIDDVTFWRGIASAISLKQLSSLARPIDTDNLQQLMSAGASTLRCRQMNVRTGLMPSDGDALPRWRLEKGAVHLVVADYQAAFGEDGATVAEFVSRVDSSLTIESLVDRIGLRQVDEIVLSGSREQVAIRGTEGQSAALTDTFKDLQTGHSTKGVDSALVVLSDGTRVEVDFRKLGVGTKTKSHVSIALMAAEGLDLLIELSPRDREFLEELTTMEATAPEGSEETLF